MVDIGYYGTKDTHLIGIVDINEAYPGVALATGLHAPNGNTSLHHRRRAEDQTSGFAAVPQDAVRPGNAGRGVVRGPGFGNWDVSLNKNVALSERFNLQLRGESFNFLKPPEPGWIRQHQHHQRVVRPDYGLPGAAAYSDCSQTGVLIGGGLSLTVSPIGLFFRCS